MNIHGIRGGKDNEETSAAATPAGKLGKKDWFSLDSIKGRLPSENSKGLKDDEKHIRIDQVCLVIRCTRTLARQYLEASDWNVDNACSKYLDDHPAEKSPEPTEATTTVLEAADIGTSGYVLSVANREREESSEESSSSSSYESDSSTDERPAAAKPKDNTQRSAMQQRLLELSSQQQAK